MKKQSSYRYISAVLAIIMVFGMTPVLAAERLAEKSLFSGAGSEIIAFESLADDVANRTVSLGTNEESLNLPDRLTATVHRITWATPSNGTLDDNQDFEEELLVSVPVIWSSQPAYDGNTACGYVFTPSVPGYTLAEDILLPSILVQVSDGVDDNGITPMNGISPLNGISPMDTMSIYAAQSFTLETSKTEMFDQSEPDNSADYTTNVIYYPHTEDTLTGTYVAGIYGATSDSGQATMILRFPADRKLLLGGVPQLTVYQSSSRVWPWYLITPENVLTEEYLSGMGMENTILYSVDGGEHFSEELQPDTDAIGLRMVADDGVLQNLISAGTFLCLKAEFPVSVNGEQLTQDEAGGNIPLKGWKSLQSSSPLNFGNNVYLSSPQISGTIRRQESSEGSLNWTSADKLSGQVVELLSGNTVIDTTVTNEDGEYTFYNISTLEKLQVRITAAEGTVYFADAATEDFQQTNSVPVGSVTDIDRVSGRFPNITWKNSAGTADVDVLNYQNAKFIVVASAQSNPPATVCSVTFDCQGGSTITTLTGLPGGSTIAAPESPLRAGYSFAGWFKESAFSTAWDFGNDAVTRDTILYAKWIPAESSTSNNHGGSSQPGSPDGNAANAANNVDIGNQPDIPFGESINYSSHSPSPVPGNASGNNLDGIPKTGDRNSNLIWWVLVGISLAVLPVQVIFISRNKVYK